MKTIRQDEFPEGHPGGCEYNGKEFFHGVRCIVSKVHADDLRAMVARILAEHMHQDDME